MRLSIIIPSRDRIVYLKETIKTALAIDSADIEIIVSDNASEDQTQNVLSDIKDIRFRYINTENRISMRANFEFALKHSTGDYIMFIGDDDGVLPKQIPLLKLILSKHMPDVLRWPTIKYGWPELNNAKTGGVRINKDMVYGTPFEINSKLFSNEVLDCDLRNEKYFPGIYHGVVSRAYINKLKTEDGQFFNCTIPDVFFNYQALFSGGKHMYCPHPFSINGYSPSSNGGAQKKLAYSKTISPIALQFMAENKKDRNLDIADFGASISAVFFLSLETARVYSKIDTSNVNYYKWFIYLLQNIDKMNSDIKSDLVNSLKFYAKEINQLDILEELLATPKQRGKKFLKFKQKLGENINKIGSIRFSCEKNNKNNIYTASQVCDYIISGDLSSENSSFLLHKVEWKGLKRRYKKILKLI